MKILLTQNSTTQALNHEARIKRKRAQSGTKNTKLARIKRKRAQNGTKNIKMVTKKF